jgi:hypothetical protein
MNVKDYKKIGSIYKNKLYIWCPHFKKNSNSVATHRQKCLDPSSLKSILITLINKANIEVLKDSVNNFSTLINSINLDELHFWVVKLIKIV